MEFSTRFLNGYISDLINIREFREGNSYSTQQLKFPEITERSVPEELHSIDPNIELSKLANEMKESNARLEKHISKDVFTSSDTLGSQCVLPICDKKLQTLDSVKSDLCQAKRTRMCAPPPSWTPRGNTDTDQTLLITVTFYHPFEWLHKRVRGENVRPHGKDSIQFHDGQTLRAVRRAFVCQNIERDISGDVGHNPHKPFEFLENIELKRPLFYINNNIYVESQPDKITKEHTAAMKKWANDNGYIFGNVLSLDTKLMDLEVRIGEPYVYQHSGRCEHLFVFNEIRFAQPNNSLGFSSYPRIISISKEKLKNCIFCNKSVSEIAMVSEEAPLNMDYMCEACFISFNYNDIGEKIDCFETYRAIEY